MFRPRRWRPKKTAAQRKLSPDEDRKAADLSVSNNNNASPNENNCCGGGCQQRRACPSAPSADATADEENIDEVPSSTASKGELMGMIEEVGALVLMMLQVLIVLIIVILSNIQ